VVLGAPIVHWLMRRFIFVFISVPIVVN